MQDLATTLMFESDTTGVADCQVLYLNACVDGGTLSYAKRMGLRQRGTGEGRFEFVLEHTEFEVLLK